MTAVSAEVSGVRGAPSGNPDVPEAGQLVRVRGQQWVVSSVNNSRQLQDELAATRIPGRTLVTLSNCLDYEPTAVGQSECAARFNGPNAGSNASSSAALLSLLQSELDQRATAEKTGGTAAPLLESLLAP